MLFLISIIPFIITSNAGFDYFHGYENFSVSNLFQLWVDKDLGIIPAYHAPIYIIYFYCVSLLGHKLGSLTIWIFFINLGCIYIILLFREVLLYLDIKSNNKVPEFIVGLFYISCIPIQFSINTPFSFNLIYPFSLIIFYLLFHLVNKEDKNIIKTSILLSITSFFFLGLQIVFIIFLAIFVLILLLYFILNKDIKTIEGIKLVTIFIILYTFISFPYYYTSIILPYTTQSDLVSEILTIEDLSFTQSNSFLTEVYKILGGTSYYYFYKGEYSIPAAVDYFKSPIYIILSYVGVISFSVFFIYFKNIDKKSIKTLFLVLFLISIFFMSGINNAPFLNNIYHYFYNNNTWFSIFRNGTKISFMLIIIYGISMGINMSQIKRNQNIIYSIIIFSLIILNKPLYTVDFYKYSDITLPSDVSNSIKFLNTLNERTLVVPITPFPVYTFAGRGVNPYEFSNQMKTVYNVKSAGKLNKLLQNLEAQNDLFIYQLKKMDIKYIIWSRYIDTKEYGLKDSEEYLDYYKNHFKEIKNFNDNVIIFEI